MYSRYLRRCVYILVFRSKSLILLWFSETNEYCNIVSKVNLKILWEFQVCIIATLFGIFYRRTHLLQFMVCNSYLPQYSYSHFQLLFIWHGVVGSFVDKKTSSIGSLKNKIIFKLQLLKFLLYFSINKIKFIFKFYIDRNQEKYEIV